MQQPRANLTLVQASQSSMGLQAILHSTCSHVPMGVALDVLSHYSRPEARTSESMRTRCLRCWLWAYRAHPADTAPYWVFQLTVGWPCAQHLSSFSPVA